MSKKIYSYGSAEKVEAIVKKYNFMTFQMALAHLFGAGADDLLEITDDVIDSMTREANPMFTLELAKDIIRCARELASCSLFDDIIPYFVWHHPNNIEKKVVSLDRSMFRSSDFFEKMLFDMNIPCSCEVDEIDEIDLIVPIKSYLDVPDDEEDIL